MLMRYRPSGAAPADNRLGRFVPDDWKHVEKYPYSDLADYGVASVEKTLVLPSWHWEHDQGREGSCVGHGVGMERAITNTAQNRLLALFRFTKRYDPLDLWNQAKIVDEWPDTNPGDDNGTSVRAAYDVLRTRGPRQISLHGEQIDSVTGNPVITDAKEGKADPTQGIAANRWALTTDEIRTALAGGVPVAIGVNWYANFDSPVASSKSEFRIGAGNLGRIRGGHCLCIYGASDRRQAFKLKNSWGRDYPLVWLPYTVMQRLLDEDGEAALVTDR
jgi:hypothetical protein